MDIVLRCIVLLVALTPAIEAQDTQRHITGGSIVGEKQPDDSFIFRSIPFAAPPIESLRWKPPQPVISWEGIRDTRAMATPCAQLSEIWNAHDAATSSEDCLYLSVHEPAHSPGEKLPVYVWIHGGSNRSGSGRDVAESSIYRHGIVVVGIEYRLGVFGFLASAELREESPHQSSGNYALLDQIAALEWVKSNITAFGGDPDNVTVGGQSAGAIDIGQLMRSPLAAGLFVRVIQESGVIGPPRSTEDNESIGRELLMKLKIKPGPSALSALRKVATKELLAASDKLKPPNGDRNILWLESSDDGWVIPKEKNNLYNSDNVIHVPQIVGNVIQEFVFHGTDSATQALTTKVYGRSSDVVLKSYEAVDKQLPIDDETFGAVGTQVLTDWMFRCPSYQIAKWQIGQDKKVWRYEFGIPRPGHSRLEHNAELDYAYHSAPASATPENWPPLQEYLANFIKHGDPNGDFLPNWPDMSDNASYIAFLPTGIQIGEDLHGDQCQRMAERYSKL